MSTIKNKKYKSICGGVNMDSKLLQKENSRSKQEYFIGIDIGTNSVGMSVTDTSYNLIRRKGKDMWFVRTFKEPDEAGAKGRRENRSARRRYQRRRYRLDLLQELFWDEVTKYDKDFFDRLKDSSYHKEDKTVQQPNGFFNDADYTDKDYFADFPTIYHLRQAFIKNDFSDKQKEPRMQVRYLYLVLSQFMKKRGHFLFHGTVENVTSFDNVWECLEEAFAELQVTCSADCKWIFKEVLSDKTLGKSASHKELKERLTGKMLFSDHKEEVLKLLCGMKADLMKIFPSLKEILQEQSYKISFAKFDDNEMTELESFLDEFEMNVIKTLYAVYSWKTMEYLIAGGDYEGSSFLSIAKVNLYNKHMREKEMLADVFGNRQVKVFDTRKTHSIDKNFLKEIPEDYPYRQYIVEEVENETFLLPLSTVDNSHIPYQLNSFEMKKILSVAEEYLPFLKTVDGECGFTVSEKIVKLFEFRIPYYVGMLKEKEENKNAWMKRYDDMKGVRITPWNFDKVIDISTTAENFINTRTNFCTYLRNEDVIPKNSLLFTEFMVYNTANDICVNGMKLPIEVKKMLCEAVLNGTKITTAKSLKAFLEPYVSGEITNHTNFTKVSTASYKKMRKVFGEDLKKDSVKKRAERIIYLNTVYGIEKAMLRETLKKEFPDLEEQQLKECVSSDFNGWSRFSKKFLSGLEGVSYETGECFTIMQALRNTQDNLMQLLSGRKYSFTEEIDKENPEFLFDADLPFNTKEDRKYAFGQILENMPVPTRVKRSVWQTVLMLKDVERVMGCPPKLIFVETTRFNGEKKESVPRYNQLLSLYRNILSEKSFFNGQSFAIDEHNMKETLKMMECNKYNLKAIKLFLYFTQLGRCMYSGKPIDIETLNKTTDVLWDKDHIYPQCFTKDDSLLDNLVLVEKTLNQEKKDGLLKPEWQAKMRPYWDYLLKNGLITQEKYNRLNRKTPLTDEELAGFVNRQLVETGQAVKTLTTILKALYHDKDGDKVVFVKGEMVSDFKNHTYTDKTGKVHYDYVWNYVKERSINDLHHAKDAYLNIVVGNVLYHKYTRNPLKWLKEHKGSEEEKKADFNMNQIYNRDVRGAWNSRFGMAKENATVFTINEVLAKNSIIVTTNTYYNDGVLFDVNMVSRKGTKKTSASVPSCARKNDLKKYGGYGSRNVYCLMLVESGKEGKRERTFERIFTMDKNKLSSSKDKEMYCRDTLGLVNPQIILPEVKLGSLLNLNGFYYILRGSAEKQLSLTSGIQIKLDNRCLITVKRINKFIASGRNSIKSYDRLYDDQLLYLFETLRQKASTSILKNRYKLDILISPIEEYAEKFASIDTEEKVLVLTKVLKALAPTQIHITKNICNYKVAELIYQSPTGMYERKVDLRTCTGENDELENGGYNRKCKT